MREIDGHNGPIWIRKEIIKTTVINPTVKRYSQLLNRPVKAGETIEIDISLLSEQSNVSIDVTCPMCLKEYSTPMHTISNKGHTRCQPCQQRIGAYGNYISQKIGRLTITGFGKPAVITSGGDRTTLTATCDCGNQTVVFAQSIKRAIKKNIPISCGCYGAEQSRKQGLKNSGPDNGMYRHDLTLTQRVAHKKLIRHIKRTWGKAIRRRDTACVVCNCSNALEAHHLYSTVSRPEFCLTPENGIAICTTHHQEFHCNFMGHVHAPTTPADFYSYLKSVHGWSIEQIKSLINNKHIFES